jgi:aryl-alcohol dehydrogenase-like predicted oxidoreductase
MSEIPRRQLGRTDLDVTTLGFGAMELRGPPNGPQISDEDAGRLLNAVLDEGINFIDTSIDYGRSEELIGRSIAHRRDEYVLASKCACVVGGGMGHEHVHTAENIRHGIENSLRLLRTDHLDLVQFHRSLTPEEFDAEGALSEALAIRFVGVSGFLPNLDAQVDMGVFDAYQIPYSALQRDNEDAIARASAAGAGIVVRGGVARGTPDDWENRSYYMIANETMRDHWEAAQLDELLDGSSRTAFLLRFTLSNPDLDTTIVGTSSLEHLRENIATAALGPLPDDVVAEAKRRLDAAGARSAG